MLDKNSIKETCFDPIKKEWLAAGDSFPDFLTEIHNETQIKNEKYIQEVSETFRQQLKCFPVNPKGLRKWKQKTLQILEHVLSEETVLGIHKVMDQQSMDTLQGELAEFLRQVRKFAPELSMDGIGQAIRNYIVYAMFKQLHTIRSGFSIAGFGYSMLYPFTDNYIDSPQHSVSEKRVYNQIIRDKIEGRTVHPESLYQRKTCRLLEAIEAEHPRDLDPAVYSLLLMMLDAQEDSLHQQNNEVLLTAEERLDISLNKGGISVLIDRFLVKKIVTEEDMVFYFGFGLLLQLADDLQDIREDSIKGHQTIMNVDLQPGQKEKTVNKMLHFAYRLFTGYQGENERFKNLILSNCYLLIYSSVLQSIEYFSQAYLVRLAKYYPVTFLYYEKWRGSLLKDNDFKVQEKYLKMLDELID